ncbi:GNAT family N-acetyltransferase [Arenimonas donghaensis]|uniref:GNAT family N-acetyltransferase n=1 Tax=Arenimonas donghaensis TaxID=375061 RepID=UPI0009FD91E7|nr:GNAT family N-acetyltransferase [Arenimonas donghaensis]
MLSLSSIQASDVEALEQFELENRAFFERHINARPASYYAAGGIAAAVRESQRAESADSAYQFLVRNPANELVGRVNLTRVRRENFHSAELGYRIGQSFNGRGYAREAVRLVLEVAFGRLRLRRIEAGVRPDNFASVKVLAHNGFVQFGRSTRSFQVAGTWHDLLHFERHES